MCPKIDICVIKLCKFQLPYKTSANNAQYIHLKWEIANLSTQYATHKEKYETAQWKIKVKQTEVYSINMGPCGNATMRDVDSSQYVNITTLSMRLWQTPTKWGHRPYCRVHVDCALYIIIYPVLLFHIAISTFPQLQLDML